MVLRPILFTVSPRGVAYVIRCSWRDSVTSRSSVVVASYTVSQNNCITCGSSCDRVDFILLTEVRSHFVTCALLTTKHPKQVGDYRQRTTIRHSPTTSESTVYFVSLDLSAFKFARSTHLYAAQIGHHYHEQGKSNSHGAKR